MELHLWEPEERHGQWQSNNPKGKFRASGFKDTNHFVILPPCMYVRVYKKLTYIALFLLIRMDDLICSYLPRKQSTGCRAHTCWSIAYLTSRARIVYLQLPHHLKSFFFLILFFNVYFWEGERQSTNGRCRERGRQTASEAGSRFWADSIEPDAGLEPTDCEIMTWAEVGSLTGWATQVPLT